MPPLLIVVLGCCAMIALTTLWALAARRVGTRRSWLAPIAFVLYAATGFLAASDAGFWLYGSVGGAAVAATDATIGWRVAGVLGLHDDEYTSSMEAFGATLVTLVGAAVGTVAGLIAA